MLLLVATRGSVLIIVVIIMIMTLIIILGVWPVLSIFLFIEASFIQAFCTSMQCLACLADTIGVAFKCQERFLNRATALNLHERN